MLKKKKTCFEQLEGSFFVSKKEKEKKKKSFSLKKTICNFKNLWESEIKRKLIPPSKLVQSTSLKERECL